MATIGGKKVNPFYRSVDTGVQNELRKRGEFYGARVRSGAVTKDATGFPEANKLLWSYGKVAYAIITGEGGITLGESYSRVMSDSTGALTLYDSTRNQPKYPLLQSVELSNEGTLGSLLKGSFTFVIYPDLLDTGFKMDRIEEVFFTPGKEVNIRYGWSVRDSGPGNGSLTGIIYNFDWNVNTDLSITAKCSIVSKATIAIGVSGEQTTPTKDGETLQTDPLGQPIPNGDIAGIMEWDIKNLGGANNTSVTLGQVKLYPAETATQSKKLSYYVIGMPMSLVDLDNSVLNQEQQQQKQQYQAQQETTDKKNQQVKNEVAGYISLLEKKEQISNAKAGQEVEYEDFDETGKSLGTKKASKEVALDFIEKFEKRKNEAIIARAKIALTLDDGQAADILRQVQQSANNAVTAKKAASSGTSGTSGNIPQTIQASPYVPPKTPPPTTQPIYYVKLGDLVTYVNKILENSPLGRAGTGLFEVQCFGNTTQHLPDIVSSAPEEVFFPDNEMGKYGTFAPFGPGAGTEFLKDVEKKSLIDISAILISTTAVINAYRGLVKENQTSIEYKNITGFFDSLIKLVNYASGEMYQLATQLIDPPKGGTGRAILSIEDTHISKAVTDSVTPFAFNASIASPILKSISISCKPPAASAAATFTLARGNSGETAQTDVRFNAAGRAADYAESKKQIDAEKTAFITKGAGKTFSTGLKGNYAKYKRSVTYDNAKDDAHWLRKVIYPIDLTLTIDGIDGFNFGDVISTNLIPARYNKENMVFVVTKISHTIQNGVWETTLNTKSRIEPQ
jgi:ribosomal protein S17E